MGVASPPPPPNLASLSKMVRLIVYGAEDLLGHSQGQPGGIQDLVPEEIPQAPAVEFIHHPAARADLYLQQLRQPEAAAGLAAFGLQDPGASQVFDWLPRAVIFNLQTEVEQVVWQHAQSGLLAGPPADWEMAWSAGRRARFRQQFRPLGEQTVEAYRGDFLQVARELQSRLDTQIIVLGCSSYDPADRVRNYARSGETGSLRAHRFNLALLELSRQVGLAVVDVDRIIAEMGAGENVSALFSYSAAARLAIRGELLRVLADLGLFAEPPACMQLRMPYVSRQIRGGTILRWHKRPGDRVQTGDHLFDFRVDEIEKIFRTGESWLTPSGTVLSTKRDLEFEMRVTASGTGFLHSIRAGAGAYCRAGQEVAYFVNAAGLDLSEPAWQDAPRLRVVTNFLDG